jgi:hypothetical protein
MAIKHTRCKIDLVVNIPQQPDALTQRLFLVPDIGGFLRSERALADDNQGQRLGKVFHDGPQIRRGGAPQVIVSGKSASRIAGHYWTPVQSQQERLSNHWAPL